MKPILKTLLVCGAMLALAGCATQQSVYNRQLAARRVVMMQKISQEKPGNYYIGLRYYKRDYKFWGYVRKPGQPWSTAKLVMLNENKKLAPDRARNAIGSDAEDTYKLQGYYSGDTVYEPASNGFYPEFVLTGYQLLSTTPPPVFHSALSMNPMNNIVEKPF